MEASCSLQDGNMITTEARCTVQQLLSQTIRVIRLIDVTIHIIS
jgi:hypothetical protein